MDQTEICFLLICETDILTTFIFSLNPTLSWTFDSCSFPFSCPYPRHLCAQYIQKKKRLSEVVLVIHQYLRPWLINFITLYNSSKFHYCFVLNVSFTLEIILFTGYCRMSFFAPYVPTAHFKVNYKKKLKLVKQ